MKKRLLALFLMIVMSVSLLAGCGGSDDSDSDKESSIIDENEPKQDEEDLDGIETVTYDVTDRETGNIMKCEITYDADNIYVAIDEENPVASLSEDIQLFNHIGSGAGGSVYVVTGDSLTVSKRYEDAKELAEWMISEGTYKDVTFTDITTEMIGDIEAQTFSSRVVLEDGTETVGDVVYMIEFADGIMIIELSLFDEELPYVQETLEAFLIHVTLNGKEPKTSSDADNVVTENDNTLTASDLLIPTIEIDGVVYTFPMEAQELVDNGWVMDELSVERPANPGEMVAMEFYKDDMTLFTNISTTTGETQSLEECEVCSIYYSAESDNINVPITFPGNITLGMSKAEVEQILPDEFEYNAEYHYFKYRYDTEKGEIAIEIYMTEDDSVVESISYTCWTD